MGYGGNGNKPIIQIDNKELKDQIQTLTSNLVESATDLKLTGTKIQLKKEDGTTKGVGIDIPTVGIDDAVTVTDKVWSSQKTQQQIQLIPKGDKGDKGDAGSASVAIDDAVTNSSQTWSSTKIQNGLNMATPVDGSITPEKTSWMTIVRTNLFDKTKAVLGSVNQTTGAIGVFAAGYVSDFIKVTEGQTYKTQASYNSGYYDANKNFVQGLSGHNGNITVPTGLGITYIRIAFVDTALNTIMFVKGTMLPSPYVPYTTYSVDITGGEVKTAIEAVSNNLPVSISKLDFLKEKRTNLFDKTKAILGAVNQTTGNIDSFGGGYVSDFIPIEEGKNYRTQPGYDSGYYNASKQFVQGFKLTTQTPLTVPTGLGIKYVRIGFVNTALDTTMFVEGSDLPISYVPYTYWGPVFATEDMKTIFKNDLGISASPLFGMRVNFLGDSTTNNTYGKPYHQWIAERTGISARNYGVNGSSIAVRGGTTTSMFERYTTMLDDADAVILFGGRNDITNVVPIGAMSDRVNNTMYGACHLLLVGLIEKFPAKKIGVMLPLQRQNDTIAINYVNVIKEVAEYYSIPVLDLFRGSGLTPNLASSITNYIPDGLHPNDIGHQIISGKIEAFLRRL